MSKRIRTRNPDFIKGVNFPLQTYAWSGAQWGSSLDEVNGKRSTNKSPMLITSQPPGASAKDDTSWKLTFGASHDCVFTLFNGKFFNTTSLFKIPENLGGIYRDSIGTGDQNIYEQVNGVQQIQYVVSKNTAKEGRDAETYGADVDDARGIGMRIPMMAGGWGRTIGMRPTDPEPTEDSRKRRNDEEHKLARETWKYGPVDLRWDDRRGVWGAWNDIIADHNEQNLGTLVFDTNPDAAAGFPFFKGKIEDAWKIILDKPDSPTGVDKDTDKSGNVATHLNHNWAQLDEGTWKFAPLSSTFKIHRAGTPIGSVGNERFETSFIEILTPTFFHLDDSFHGPICFTKEDIKDSDLTGCMKFDGAQWIPTVTFDPCSDVGVELGVLFANDKVLADKIIEVCKMLLECIGKADGEVDTGKAQDAAEKSATADAENTGAKNALDAVIGTGTGPGGSFVAGDTLGPGASQLTAGEAANLNNSLPAASAAYSAAADAQDQAGIDTANAGEAQAAADTAAQDLGNSTAAANEAQAAADAANAALAESPNDGSTKEAAQKANEANSEAQADKNASTKEFNDANDAAEAAKEVADASHEKAVDATKDAKDASDQVKEDGNGKIPEDLINEMDEANEANEEADQAREDAGIGEDDDETTDEKIEEANKELSDKIDGLACEKAEDLIAMGDAMGEAIQKLAFEMTDSFNQALFETIASVNEALGEIVGYDEETASGGIVETPAETPAFCPIEAIGSGKVVPGLPQETEEQLADSPSSTTTGPDDGTGTGSVVKPTGGSQAPPPPGQEAPGDGSVVRPPAVPPPPPPSCPLITIKDPCGGFSTHGPCPSGKGSGTPGGTATPGEGDPGNPDSAPTGGVNDGGQTFLPGTGGTFGLGAQNL